MVIIPHIHILMLLHPLSFLDQAQPVSNANQSQKPRPLTAEESVKSGTNSKMAMKEPEMQVAKKKVHLKAPLPPGLITPVGAITTRLHLVELDGQPSAPITTVLPVRGEASTTFASSGLPCVSGGRWSKRSKPSGEAGSSSSGWVAGGFTMIENAKIGKDVEMDVDDTASVVSTATGVTLSPGFKRPKCLSWPRPPCEVCSSITNTYRNMYQVKVWNEVIDEELDDEGYYSFLYTCCDCFMK